MLSPSANADSRRLYKYFSIFPSIFLFLSVLRDPVQSVKPPIGTGKARKHALERHASHDVLVNSGNDAPINNNATPVM